MPEVEISAILAELREKAQGNSPAKALKQPSDRRPPAVSPVDLATIARYDILAEPFASHRRGILARFIILLKNFARELLVQILERQVRYNEANTEIARALSGATQYLGRAQVELRRQVGSLETDFATRLKDIESGLVGRLDAMQLELQRYRSFVDNALSTIVNQHPAASDGK